MDFDGETTKEQPTRINYKSPLLLGDVPLTISILDALPKHEIFATGTCLDNQYGINMTGSGKWIRWVACTGEIGDWAIYCYWADFDEVYVKCHGDKVRDKSNIQRTIKCDDAAFARYRY